jgi:hypothetical protein
VVSSCSTRCGGRKSYVLQSAFVFCMDLRRNGHCSPTDFLLQPRRTWHSWIRASWYSFCKMTNKIQVCRIIYCSLTALHVLSDIFAHHQEHLNCNYSFWFYSRVSSAAVVAEPWQQPTAPDDERKYRSKHVEQSGNNKLSYTDASCWSFCKNWKKGDEIVYCAVRTEILNTVQVNISSWTVKDMFEGGCH